MPHPLLATDAAAAVPIWPVTPESFPALRDRLSTSARGFAAAQGFEPKPGNHCLLPAAEGGLEGVLFGVDDASGKRADPFLVGKLPTVLPQGVYRLEGAAFDPTLATLAWLLGGYRFERYREPGRDARPARAAGRRRRRTR